MSERPSGASEPETPAPGGLPSGLALAELPPRPSGPGRRPAVRPGPSRPGPGAEPADRQPGLPHPRASPPPQAFLKALSRGTVVTAADLSREARTSCGSNAGICLSFLSPSFTDRENEASDGPGLASRCGCNLTIGAWGASVDWL